MRGHRVRRHAHGEDDAGSPGILMQLGHVSLSLLVYLDAEHCGPLQVKTDGVPLSSGARGGGVNR
jgi:hypothetical protein